MSVFDLITDKVNDVVDDIENELDSEINEDDVDQIEDLILITDCIYHRNVVKDFYIDCNCQLGYTKNYELYHVINFKHRINVYKIKRDSFKIYSSIPLQIREKIENTIPIKYINYNDSIWLNLFQLVLQYFNNLAMMDAKHSVCFHDKMKLETLITMIFHYIPNRLCVMYRCLLKKMKNKSFLLKQYTVMFDMMLYLITLQKKKSNSLGIPGVCENCKLKKFDLRPNVNIVSDILHKIYCVDLKMPFNKIITMLERIPLPEANESISILNQAYYGPNQKR